MIIASLCDYYDQAALGTVRAQMGDRVRQQIFEQAHAHGYSYI